MTDDGVWATEAEILATAAALNTDIFIFCKVGKLNKWLNHSAITLGSPILNDRALWCVDSLPVRA
jgi:hypothetical protein